MARPQKYTDDQIVSALRDTKGMVFLAAKKIGCDPDTIYLRAKKSKKIAAALKMERGTLVDTAELKLRNAVLKEQPWAIRMTLTCPRRDRGYLEQYRAIRNPEGNGRTPRTDDQICQRCPVSGVNSPH